MVPSRPRIGAMSDAIGWQRSSGGSGTASTSTASVGETSAATPFAFAPLRFLRGVMSTGLPVVSSPRERREGEASGLCSRWQTVGDEGKRSRGGLRRATTCPVKADAEGGVGSKNVFEVLQDAMATTTTTVASKISKGSRSLKKLKRQVTHFQMAGKGVAGAREAAQASSRGASAGREEPDHLCVLVHGLGGTPFDWTAIACEFEKRAKSRDGDPGLLVHVSKANSFLKTFDGIDTCGERLAQEIREVVAENPGLKSLSVVGHSLGGLISRYALGVMFCGETGTMYGLRPRHFATIVSPHLGCDSSRASESEVPFLGFLTGLPVVGAGIGLITNVAAGPGAAILYRRTGRQLFLRDSNDPGNDGLPVVFQLAVNGLSEEIVDYHYDKFFASDPGAGERRQKLLPFGRALASFRTRTLYSNVRGDHMVSWPNASIRKVAEMPAHLLGAEKRGIVAETGGEDGAKKRSSLRRKMTIDIKSQTRLQDVMIESLNKLKWLRVDVKLDTGAGKLPHNYIQARPADQHSLQVTNHLMEVLKK